MNFQTLLAIMAVAILLMAWYANKSKRDMILCTFIRVNKTQIVKFVKMQSRYVNFEGRKYDIVSSRVTFRHYDNGFIHKLFPQFVPCLTYTYNSRWPLDPVTQSYTAETPESRQLLNKTEWWESMNKGSKPQQKINSKLGGFAQYLPWVAIGLVVIVAFYFNSKMTGFGNTLDAVINSINTLAK